MASRAIGTPGARAAKVDWRSALRRSLRRAGEIGGALLLFGAMVFLFLALFHGKGVLWLDDDRLVYLSGLFSQTNVADIAEATVESRRRGFGKLSYLVMTLTNGRQLFVPLRVCKRPAEDLLHDIAQLQGH